MSEPKKRGSGWPALIAGACVTLPILYVLSVGPAAWLLDRRMLDERIIRSLYSPLSWIDNHFPEVGKYIIWYMRLFYSK